MKVIISHDVDHIYPRDHVFKDLILEKMFIRSLIQLFLGRIGFATCFYRCTMVFRKRMNRIKEVVEFDKSHNIPSTFFFGMSNVLGMSYSPKTAGTYIDYVVNEGFDAGVHGCEYVDEGMMKDEHDRFGTIAKIDRFGIRNHYVRFDDRTFEKMSQIGYCYDSTYFNKIETELINPFKVGKMWEFPLHIMDVYACKQGFLEDGIKFTRNLIDEASDKGIEYLTILFHDYQFDDVFDPQMKEWYERTVEYCENCHYEFISYYDAIKELEQSDHNTICK